MSNRVDRTGLRFGNLVVIKMMYGKSTLSATYAVCECDCGNACVKNVKNIVKGKGVNCGCITSKVRSRLATKHGGCGSRAYGIWSGMINRCYNTRNKDYRHYGGRGIDVSPEWRLSFSRFISDMGEPDPGMTLDRIENDAAYCVQNCKWSDRKEQANNRRERVDSK